MASLAPFPKFEVYGEENSVGIRWNKYVTKLENLFIAQDINSKKRKKALLLYYAGDDVFGIYEILNLGESDSNYDEVKQSLGHYFQPKRNREFERYEFRNICQNSDESIDQFATRLRQKAENCEFVEKDNEIKSQIIQGCSSRKLRLKCLEEDKSLNDLLTMARTMEIAERQSNAMGRQLEPVNKINRDSTRTNYKSSGTKQVKQKARLQMQNQVCRNCGGNYPHQNGNCPAFGKSCNYCHKKNHFKVVCRKRTRANRDQSRQVREVSEQNDSDSSLRNSDISFGLSMNVVAKCKKVPTLTLKVNSVNVQMLIDTGSSLNIIDEAMINKMKPRPRMQKTKTRAYAFGQKKPLPIKGKYTLTLESDDKFATVDFHVVSGSADSLISYETAVELGIIPVIKMVSNDIYTDLCDKYKQVFSGLGKLKDKQVKFHIDEKVIPTAQQARRIPFHVREQVEQELKRLEDLDVIERVDGPTPWVSNLVVAPKPNSPNEIRMCVDMRKANKAIQREKHVTPTVDDIIFELNGSKIFSKVDLNNAFHQIELAPESRNMTTFATHIGLRRYKRLNFGVNAAPEIFQNEIRQAITGLDGTFNIADDIIIHAANRETHDARLEALLKRLHENNLTLNKQKCEFGKNTLKFYGYIFSEKGISPDPSKIEAIKNMEKPKDAGEIRSFLGMTNYVSRFINDYSTISEPLRRLTKQNQVFSWEEEQETAFNQLKSALTSDQVMTYFDPAINSEVWVDASPVGVSAILIQGNKVVAYGSKSLTPTEQRYSQTEREALACVFGCQHFYLYLFGKQFTLITDHRPLESIFNNTKQIQSARLERWRLKLTTYNFVVKYRPGNQMIADYCSRHPITTNTCENIAEDYVSFIAHTSMPGSLTIVDVAKATHDDCVTKCVIAALQNNNWGKQICSENEKFKIYKQVSEELAIITVGDQHILLRGTRLCIPESLQRNVVDLAHEGHQGRVRCKSLLRETLWFPYMDRLVDNVCTGCIPCLAVSPYTTPDQIKPSPLPQKPWSEVSIDFCGPFPSGDYFMVVIDDYSRFPAVERLTSITSQNVIQRLEAVFGIFGIPDIAKTDNGAPFNSHMFSEFAKQYGFKHRKITPLHPMANATAEAFMKPLAKAIRTAAANGQNYKTELSHFLLNYRSTPHPSTGLSPAEIIFGRKIKTKLPQFSVTRNDRYIRQRDSVAKAKNKHYADCRRNTKPCTLKSGDSVLVKQKARNKLDTPFNPTPGKVVNRKGSMVTVQHKERLITRDASHFKMIPSAGVQNTYTRSEASKPPDKLQQQLRRSDRTRKKPRRYLD